MKARLRAAAPDLGVLAMLVVLTVMMTWPIARNPATGVSDLIDSFHLMWLMSWSAHTALTRPWELAHPPAFFPFDNGIGLSEHLIGGGLIAMPVWAATHNAVLVFNFVILATFVIGSFGAYLLVRDVTGWRPAGLAAGIVFGFSAYRLSRAGQVHVGLTMWFPYTLLLFRRFLTTGRFAHAFGFAGFVWLQLISSLHGMQILVTTLPVAAAVLAFPNRVVLKTTRFWVAAGAAGVVLALATLPIVLPYLRVYQDNPQLHRSSGEVALYSAGPRGLLTAPHSSRLYAGKVNALGLPYHFEKTLFPGVITAAFAAAGVVVAARRRASPDERTWGMAFAALAVWTMALSIGTDESLGGVFGTAQRVLPGFDAFRVAGRFQTMTTLALAGLAGLAVASFRRLGGRGAHWVPIAGASAAALLLLADVLPARQPEPQRAYEVPQVYRWLAREPPDTAVLELPTGEREAGVLLSWTFMRESRFLFFQTRHWRPILNGFSSNWPPTYDEMVDAVADFPSPGSIRYLRSTGVRYVILHRDMVEETKWEGAEEIVRAKAPHAVLLDQGDQVVLDVRRLADVFR